MVSKSDIEFQPLTKSFFFLINLLLFLAALGLRCVVWAFSSCSRRGLLFIEVGGLLILVASLLFLSLGSRVHGVRQLVACWLQSTGSVAVVHGVIYSKACGIFPDQGWNPCVGWQVLIHCATRKPILQSLLIFFSLHYLFVSLALFSFFFHFLLGQCHLSICLFGKVGDGL